MFPVQSKADASFGVSLIVSTVIHMAVFLLLVWWGQLFPAQIKIQETYYVDVVNLPVASPRAGSPAQKGVGAEAPTPPAPEAPMSVPAASQPRAAAKTTSPQKTLDNHQKTAEASSEFSDRLAKLQGKADSMQEEAALERLRRKVNSGGSGRAGMPGGTGNQAGSDYSAYIKSRLEDALANNTNYSTKDPVVEVRLFIDANGRLTRRKTERTSGDRAFEISVLAAIEKASEKFPPPPTHKLYEGLFIIKPQGISSKRP